MEAAMPQLFLRKMHNEELHINHWVSLAKGKVVVDGQLAYEQSSEENCIQLLKRIFKDTDKSYSKFHKMDRICKVAYISSELLIQKSENIPLSPENVALVFSNSSATIETDKKFQESLSEIPSPSIFVYTLPNIMLGEICIRNKFKGENLFFVEPRLNTEILTQNTQMLFQHSNTKMAILAWVDFYSTESYECYMALISKEKKGAILTKENLNSHFEQ